MNILFELNHPKHYYQFKYIINILKKRGHKIKIVARDKDILLSLLKEEKVDFEIFGTHNDKLAFKIFSSISIFISYNIILRKFKPDLIISKASIYSTLLAKIKNINSIIFPDSEVVFLTNKFVAPLATKIITPQTFKLNYGKKQIRVQGLFENCYLHPNVFRYEEKIINELKIVKPYVLLRFIGWTANHDIGKVGISDEKKIDIVHKLSNNFHVYITSEKKLPEELEPYKLKIPFSKIHQVLAGAELYIGDSQTMATEAGLLGTPSIRTNSFVGENDMSNFIFLETKYGLIKNVSLRENLFEVIDKFIHTEAKKEWQLKKEKYFADTGDLNEIIANIIENTFFNELIDL
jgi:predicted glycosyltransferase